MPDYQVPAFNDIERRRLAGDPNMIGNTDLTQYMQSLNQKQAVNMGQTPDPLNASLMALTYKNVGNPLDVITQLGKNIESQKAQTSRSGGTTSPSARMMELDYLVKTGAMTRDEATRALFQTAAEKDPKYNTDLAEKVKQAQQTGELKAKIQADNSTAMQGYSNARSKVQDLYEATKNIEGGLANTDFVQAWAKKFGIPVDASDSQTIKNWIGEDVLKMFNLKPVTQEERQFAINEFSPALSMDKEQRNKAFERMLTILNRQISSADYLNKWYNTHTGWPSASDFAAASGYSQDEAKDILGQYKDKVEATGQTPQQVTAPQPQAIGTPSPVQQTIRLDPDAE